MENSICQSCPARVVCRCLNIAEDALRETIHVMGITTVREVRNLTGAGDGCNCCHRRIQRLIDETATVSTRTASYSTQ